MDDAERRRFERVVFWKLDRLARNLRDLLDICDRLEAAGVGIVSIQEGIDTGTAAGRMYRNVLGSLVEFERELIFERIKAGIAEKARQGELVGPLPLGYTRDESGAITPDRVVAPLIRDAFARHATGEYSLREMARWANELGLRSVEGNCIDRLSIRKILINVAYVGQVAYYSRRGGGVVAKGKHTAIVDAALFAKVQKTLACRRWYTPPARPFGREPYPLSGVAVCGACGAPLLGCASIVLGKYRYRHMRCSTAQRQGREACRQPMVRAELLEAQIAAYVGGMRLPPEYLGEVVAELRRRQQSAPADPSEAEGLGREVERWRRLFVLGEIDEERYRREASPLRRRLAELHRPQEVLDVEQAVKYLRDVGSLWAQSPRRLQKEFVREVFHRIIVEGPELVAITPRPVHAPLFVLDRRGETLFIDARKMGKLIDRIHRELTGEEIAAVAGTYRAWRADPDAGEYQDVPGFCKAATINDIRQHGYILTPGRYVGAAEADEDDEPFEEKMKRLVVTLDEQFQESATLEQAIRANLNRLGYDL